MLCWASTLQQLQDTFKVETAAPASRHCLLAYPRTAQGAATLLTSYIGRQAAVQRALFLNLSCLSCRLNCLSLCPSSWVSSSVIVEGKRRRAQAHGVDDKEQI
jgi:hypothetical protein